MGTDRLDPTPEDVMADMFKNAVGARASEFVVDYRGMDRRKVGRTEEDMAEEVEDFWVEEPVTFREFVSSPEHLSQPELSPRQASDIQEFLGNDPKRLFLNPETPYREAVLLWGKGGGKDWLCSLIQCWVLYVLLCMKNPGVALGMPRGENIDIINVAYSADQARDVFFTKFTGRLKHWPWLWRKYLMVESSRMLNKADHPNVESNMSQQVVHIKADMVEFPFSIMAHSAHSENESYEGKSPIFWVMDEAAAFRTKGKQANGVEVRKTLKSSAKSRFAMQYRGLIISWTRSKTDCSMQFYEEAQDDPEMFRSRAATWEVNPTVSESDFASDFKQDPVDAKAKYMCQPPGSEFGFFDEEMVAEIFIPTMRSSVETLPALIQGRVSDPRTGLDRPRRFVGKVLDRLLLGGTTGIRRVIHVDGGLTGDSAGMIIGHGLTHIFSQKEEDGKVYNYKVKKLMVDAALIWKPDKGQGLQVSLNNVASIISGLMERGMRVGAVSYDQWNSASSIEALTMQGVWCEMHNIDTDDYSQLKTFINLGAVEVPVDEWTEWKLLQDELEQLEAHQSGNRLKLDHPEDGSKELADCLAGCMRLLNNPDVRHHARKHHAPGILMGESPGARTAGSPYAGTAGIRGRSLTPAGQVGSVVGGAIQQSQPRARIGRVVAGREDELPYTNKEGQAFKPPRPRSMTRG